MWALLHSAMSGVDTAMSTAMSGVDKRLYGPQGEYLNSQGGGGWEWQGMTFQLRKNSEYTFFGKQEETAFQE